MVSFRLMLSGACVSFGSDGQLPWPLRAAPASASAALGLMIPCALLSAAPRALRRNGARKQHVPVGARRLDLLWFGRSPSMRVPSRPLRHSQVPGISASSANGTSNSSPFSVAVGASCRGARSVAVGLVTHCSETTALSTISHCRTPLFPRVHPVRQRSARPHSSRTQILPGYRRSTAPAATPLGGHSWPVEPSRGLPVVRPGPQ